MNQERPACEDTSYPESLAMQCFRGLLRPLFPRKRRLATPLCPVCPFADLLILVRVLVNPPRPPSQAVAAFSSGLKRRRCDGSLNWESCQAVALASAHTTCTTPPPSDGGEIYKQDKS
jgi:hypothetical protein